MLYEISVHPRNPTNSYQHLPPSYMPNLFSVQIPFFMIKQSNDMISLIDGHDQRL